MFVLYNVWVIQHFQHFCFLLDMFEIFLIDFLFLDDLEGEGTNTLPL